MKNVMLAVMLVFGAGSIHAEWESGCTSVVSGSNTEIQMEDWNNAFCENADKVNDYLNAVYSDTIFAPKETSYWRNKEIKFDKQ